MKSIALALLLVGCSVAHADPCEPPEDPATCALLERMGLVSVTCARSPQTGVLTEGGAYASPNDDCDDTAGINAAAKRARARSTLWLPAGELQPWPFTGVYLVSASVDVSATHVRGERAASHHQGTRIAVMPGTTMLPPDQACEALPTVAIADPLASCGAGAVLRAGGNLRIEDVVIEAGPSIYMGGSGHGSAAYGLFTYKSHGYQIERVIVRGATAAGIVLDYSMLGVMRESIANGGALDGVRFVGASGSSVYGVGGSNNGRHGVVVTTRAQASAGATGEVMVIGGDVEANGGVGLLVLGTSGTAVQGVRSEGNAWDGIRVDSASMVTIERNRLIAGVWQQHPTWPSESRFHGIALYSCRACAVRGNSIAGSAGSEDIWTEGDSRYLWIAENLYFGGTTPTDYPGGNIGAFEVVSPDVPSNSLVRYTQHQSRSLARVAPPTSGNWRAGDVVWSRAATGPRGWQCAYTTTTYGYTCAVWAPVSAQQ